MLSNAFRPLHQANERKNLNLVASAKSGASLRRMGAMATVVVPHGYGISSGG
jgi:hypothetical protein